MPKKEEAKVKIRFLPDSPQAILRSMENIGYQEKLERAVRAAMNRVRGKK